MPQLKQAVVEAIHSALDNQLFTAADFEILFPDKGSTYVNIKFRHNPTFVFSIAEESVSNIASPFESRKVPATYEVPGDFKLKETHRFDSFNECVKRIDTWCRNIHADLRARVPILDEFEELQAKVEEHIKEHLTDPDAYFNRDEINKLSSRFDELFQQFVLLEEKHQLTENELTEIKREFDVIKNNANNYPKGLWANLTTNRIVTIMRKVVTSKEGRQLMFEGAKKMIGLNAGGAP